MSTEAIQESWSRSTSQGHRDYEVIGHLSSISGQYPCRTSAGLSLSSPYNGGFSTRSSCPIIFISSPAPLLSLPPALQLKSPQLWPNSFSSQATSFSSSSSSSAACFSSNSLITVYSSFSSCSSSSFDTGPCPCISSLLAAGICTFSSFAACCHLWTSSLYASASAPATPVQVKPPCRIISSSRPSA